MRIETNTLAGIRSEVCNTTLEWLVAVGALGVVLSLLRVVETGWRPVMALHITAFGVVVALTVWRDAVPYATRATAVVATVILLAVGGNLAFGSPTGNPYYVSGTIMAAVLFGETIGLATLAFCVCAIIAHYLALRAGVLTQPEVSSYASAATSWMSTIGAITIASLGPMVALSRFQQHLDLGRRRAEEANAAKSSFLAMMSHELRTPMAGILGIADLLLEDELPAEQEERVARIVKSGRLLLSILNDLLDFSKIEAGQLTLERRPFSLDDVIGEVFDLLQPLAVEKNLELRLDRDPSLTDEVIGDSLRLRQVMLNLIGNAIKFTETGWVALSVTQSIRPAGEVLLQVTITDTGIGILPELQTRLFQPFSQADNSTWRRYGGTGLGLAISRRLVHLMDGEITYLPRPDGGSIFSFSAELSGNPGSAAIAERIPVARRGSATDRLRILVADDDETIRYLLGVMLRRWGHMVELVPDGAAALAALRQSDYDVVLMDMQMPGMDGVQATREIRALETRLAQIPVIALTADMVVKHRRAYLDAGANAIIDKPVEWGALAAELDHQCAPKTALVEAEPATHAAQTRNVDDIPQVLDESALLALSEDIGRAELEFLVGKLASNLGQYNDDLERALTTGDLVQVKKTAHSLKGLCMQFGALRVAELAKFVEREAESLEAVSALNLHKAIAEVVLQLRMRESKVDTPPDRRPS